MSEMDRKFKKRLSSLDAVFNFIDEFFEINQIDKAIIYSMHLAAEELFTNLVKYNFMSHHDILVHLQKNGRSLVMRLTDFEVESFDITKSPEVDVNQHLAERKVGGLGLHLVKQMVDKVDYEYKNKNSTITLIKYLES